MFTGIIKEIGQIKSIRRGTSWKISIQAHEISADIKIGDSVAVNGACLSAVSVMDDLFEADISTETIRRTTLGNLKAGHRVNLETSMPANGRFDGHIVQGHVDGIGRVIKLSGSLQNKMITIKPDKNPGPLVVDKGSIAINGVSLTVIEPGVNGDFRVAVIPLTLKQTTLGNIRVGNSVNLEYDIIGKYVAQTAKFC